MTMNLARQTADQRDLAVADQEQAAGALAHVLGTGDLRQLTNEQRVSMYLDICSSLGINPRTRPFDWIEFYDPETGGKKLTLYANHSCAAQLRRQHQISVRFVRREPIGGQTDDAMFVVEVEGTTPNGRTGSATKYVSLMGRQKGGGTYRLSGQQLANAYMKAETGALRRLTFSMVGMYSPPDVDELRQVRVVTVDGTGAILDRPTVEQKALAERPDMAAAIGEPTYESTAADWPDGADLFDGMPDQRPRAEEIDPPKPPAGPRATFKVSQEVITRFRQLWFGIVSGLSLDTDDARHRYVAAWTADEWPKAKRTHSLSTMRARMTDAEAEDFLAHVRTLMEAERQALLEDAEEGRPPSGDPVHDAVQLTGGPAEPAF